MTKPIVSPIIRILFLGIVLTGCSEIRERPETVDQQIVESDTFAMYSSKDTLFVEENVTKQIPFVDRYIVVMQSKTRLEKLKTIADTLSKLYFNGLTITITDSFGDAGGGSIARVDLVERDDYHGAGTVKAYQSWYDYFQGSAGGQNTTIALRESLLQRQYKDEWVDSLVFYYQGEPIGNWDHIALQGFIKR